MSYAMTAEERLGESIADALWSELCYDADDLSKLTGITHYVWRLADGSHLVMTMEESLDFEGAESVYMGRWAA